MTITFPNGKQFVPRKSDGNEGVNTYVKMKNSVVFYNVKDKPFVALLVNRHGAYFVSCCRRAIDTETSRTFYMFATTKIDKKLIGFDRIKFAAQNTFALKVAQSLGYVF